MTESSICWLKFADRGDFAINRAVLTEIHYCRDGRSARDSVGQVALFRGDVDESEILETTEMLMISRGLHAVLLSIFEMQFAVDLLMAGTCCYSASSPFRFLLPFGL
ncbi:hypothetical protein Nepgr_006821 [Nepenthes gracilis]|uniref:Uncharacterized protein n=1 Tax=Nepenthes gracilis TaxID=150966 RepID=A0AAD3XHY8_NEPGR|nr:hypothetical protein Nepgr_006821 [Nepenthes gracilis]